MTKSTSGKAVLRDMMGVEINYDMIQAQREYAGLAAIYDKYDELLDFTRDSMHEKDAITKAVEKEQQVIAKRMRAITDGMLKQIHLDRMVTGAMIKKSIKIAIVSNF